MGSALPAERPGSLELPVFWVKTRRHRAGIREKREGETMSTVHDENGVSRRGFIGGAGILAGGALAANAALANADEKPIDTEAIAPSMATSTM